MKCEHEDLTAFPAYKCDKCGEFVAWIENDLKKTIDVSCPKCGKLYTFSDNGWSNVVCVNCGTVIAYPKVRG